MQMMAMGVPALRIMVLWQSGGVPARMVKVMPLLVNRRASASGNTSSRHTWRGVIEAFGYPCKANEFDGAHR